MDGSIKRSDSDMQKGAKEEDRPGPERSSHPGLDENGLPNDPVAIAQGWCEARLGLCEVIHQDAHALVPACSPGGPSRRGSRRHSTADRSHRLRA